MWRVDDQEAAKEARLREVQRRNERLASAAIPVDFAERVKRATRHYIVSGSGDHRRLERPPRELYVKDSLGIYPQEVIDLTSLPVTNEWLSAIAAEIHAGESQSRSRRGGENLKLLKRLCLADTPIADPGFVAVQRLRDLQEIDVSRCFALTDNSLSIVRRYFSSTLEILNISECRHFTSDVLIQLWRDCPKLHTLYAHSCQCVTDAFLQYVASTKRSGTSLGLRELDIRHCKNVTSSGVSHLATSSIKAIAMSVLRVGDCLQVDNMAFFGFENSSCLADLVALDLSGLRIDETAVSWIAKGCKQLETLDLSRCRLLNDFSMLLLTPLVSARLRRLKLKECVLLSDHGMKNLFSSISDQATSLGDDEDDESKQVVLEVLNLEGCSLVGDETLQLLGEHAANLQKLNARGLRKISDAGILALAKGCSTICSLKLSGRYITDQTFKILGKICPSLTRVDISERLDLQTPQCLLSLTSGIHPERLLKLNFATTNICDVGVSIIATSCSALRWINLSKCGQITDISIEALASCCHSLQVLLLNNARAITDRSLVACAIVHLPLQILDVCGNTNITDAGVRAVATACQQLQELRVKGCDRLSFQTLSQASQMLPLTIPPVPPSLSQTLATGGGNANAMLKPLPQHYNQVIKLLVTRYEASCVLQAKFRHWKEREKSTMFLARRRFLRQSRAASKIQKCVRRFLSWRRYLHYMELECNRFAIVYVQAHVRGNQARFRTTVKRFTYNRAAKCIQQSYRPHYEARMAIRRANTLTIQRVYRGFRGRQTYRRVVNERRVASANKIGTWYRKCRHHREARARARWLVGKIHNIQGQWRKFKRRQNFSRYLGHYRRRATDIQRIWRGFSTRRNVERLRVEWSAAATRIQGVYRSYRVRRVVGVYRALANRHVTTIQKNWRRYAGRQRYVRERRLVVQTQRMARYALAVRKLRRVVAAALAKTRHDAAQTIQRVLRGHFGRRRALLFRKIRNATYAKKGQHASQTWIRRGLVRRGAALRLQRFVRRYLARRQMLKLRKWKRVVAARCLQRYLRDWMRRVRLRRKREAQTHAAQTVQRVFRGHLGRVAFQQEAHRQACLRSAALLQRVYRGYRGRRFYEKLHREMTNAARMLQRAYRGRHARKLYEISQAAAALKAKDKYDRSIFGMLDAKRNPMDELYRRAKLPHEKETLQKLHAKWEASRVAQERALRKLSREYKAQVWPATQELVGNHLALRSRLYGVTENVYVSRREHLERQARQQQLASELLSLHRRVAQCQRALREAVASRRMLDGKEIRELLRGHGLLADVGSNQRESA